jgi:hypothetical protein
MPWPPRAGEYAGPPGTTPATRMWLWRHVELLVADARAAAAALPPDRQRTIPPELLLVKTLQPGLDGRAWRRGLAGEGGPPARPLPLGDVLALCAALASRDGAQAVAALTQDPGVAAVLQVSGASLWGGRVP